LEGTKDQLLKEHDVRKKLACPQDVPSSKVRTNFDNSSPLDIKTLMGDPGPLIENPLAYIQRLVPGMCPLIFTINLRGLQKLILVSHNKNVADINLYPETVNSARIGEGVEEGIRNFSEILHTTAARYFTRPLE
jgi:type I restriction enzyme M protein